MDRISQTTLLPLQDHYRHWIQTLFRRSFGLVQCFERTQSNHQQNAVLEIQGHKSDSQATTQARHARQARLPESKYGIEHGIMGG